MKTNINKIAVFDIETAVIPWDELSKSQKHHWNKKYDSDQEAISGYKDMGALNAEYSKVVCFSIGGINGKDFSINGECGDDEIAILNFISDKMTKSEFFTLAGHNIKGFDIPFLCKRFHINGISLPSKINFSGKKPWEINVIDTMEYWRFGSYSQKFVSLDLLCDILNVKTPKGDMDGSKVGEAFLNEEYSKILEYYNKDVEATFNVIKKLQI